MHAKIALTPVGANNPYGHPSLDTLHRLEEDGSRVYRSDLDGDVAVLSHHGRLTSVARHGDGVAPRQTVQAIAADNRCDAVLAAPASIRARGSPRWSR